MTRVAITDDYLVPLRREEEEEEIAAMDGSTAAEIEMSSKIQFSIVAAENRIIENLGFS